MKPGFEESWGQIVVIVAASLGVTGVAVLIAVAAAGAGHGSYIPAILLFPFTMLSVAVTDTISAAGMIAALLQFPIYAGLYAWALRHDLARSLAYWLLGAHGLSAAACFFALPESWWFR